MAKVPIALRLEPDVLAWLDDYAGSVSVSRQVVLEAAVAHVREAIERGDAVWPWAVAEGSLESPAVRARRALGAVPGVRRARVLAPADPLALARQAKLNKARGDAA